MALAQRKSSEQVVAAETAAARTGPWAVRDGSEAHAIPSPARLQRAALEAALSSEVAGPGRKYPGYVRLALLLGPPLAFWGTIAFLAVRAAA